MLSIFEFEFEFPEVANGAELMRFFEEDLSRNTTRLSPELMLLLLPFGDAKRGCVSLRFLASSSHPPPPPPPPPLPVDGETMVTVLADTELGEDDEEDEDSMNLPELRRNGTAADADV